MPVTRSDPRRILADYLLDRFPQLDKCDLAQDEPLLSTGILDSLGVLELVAFIEQSFPIRLADEDLVPANFERLSLLTAFVERRLPPR